MAIANTSQPQAPPAAEAFTLKSNGSAKADGVHDSTKSAPLTRTSSFLDIPLDRLYASKTNPRKHFDGPEMDELVASVREKGVLMPILVRDAGWKAPLSEEIKFEVVAGERRFRAAQAAGLKSIPARIAELSDSETLEIQIIENLQRKDVTSLEEADGYANLFKQLQLARPKAPKQELVAEIAKKIGKSVRYVYARMKLTELCDEVKKALAAGEIPASHADELVRFKPSDQKKALKECCFKTEWISGEDDDKQIKSPVSVRVLKAKLDSFYCELSAAPWKKDDATLVSLAGSCDDCPKNTANQPDFEGKKKLCVDRECFGKKRDAFIQITLTNAQKPGEPKPLMLDAQWPNDGYKGAVSYYTWSNHIVKAGSCKHQQAGVIVTGPEAGHRRIVCIDEKCKVHHKGRQSSLGLSTPKSETPEERKRREQETKQRRAAQHAVFLAALNRVKDISGDVLELAVDRAFFNADIFEENAEALGNYFGWKVGQSFDAFERAYRKAASSMSARQRSQLLFALLFSDHLEDYHANDLDKVAKALGVDTAKVRQQTIDKLKAAEAQTSAQSQTSSEQPRKASGTGAKGKSGVSSKPKAAAGKKKGGRK